MYQGKVPFDKMGNLCTYPSGVYEWRDNYVFDDQLKIVRLMKGRSAAGVIVENDKGNKFYITLNTLTEILQKYTVNKGTLPALSWTFQKRGLNYLVVPA